MTAAPKLLSRKDAAEYLGLSLRTFERHVLKYVPRVQVGGRAMFAAKDLDAWTESQKVSASAATLVRGTGSSGSGSRADDIADPQVRRTLERLKRRRNESSTRSATLRVHDGKSGKQSR